MLPLAGVRVLDLTHIAAGPYCTSMLGDMGAEVIKVERPGRGDDTRRFDQSFPGHDSSYFLGLNRSKKSVTVDLQRPEGTAIVRQLAAKVDVLVESFRAGVLDRLGLGYEALARESPHLVYCSISGFGRTGPFAHRAGMDILIQAMSGIMGLTGEPGRAPVKIGPPLCDFMTSYLALAGIVLALRVRDRHGFGQRVEVSLLDASVASLANFFTGFFATGKPDRPAGGGHPQIVPYQVFPAADRYMVVACLTERMWQRFCSAICREDLASDPRFRTNPDRVAHRELLIPILEEVLRLRAAEEWAAIFDAADVPCGPVNGLREALSHPQVLWNGMVEEVEHATIGRIKVPGVPVKLSATPGRVGGPPPLLGEHTDEVLSGLGYSPEQIARFRASGVL